MKDVVDTVEITVKDYTMLFERLLEVVTCLQEDPTI